LGDNEIPEFALPDSGVTREVRDLVREIVAEIAPDELVLVTGLEALDDAVILKRFKHPRRNEPLAFGVEELLGLITPVVWLVLEKVAEKGAEDAVDGGSKQLKGWWTNRRKPERLTVAPRPPGEYELWHAAIQATAREHNLTAEEAEALADKVVVKVVRAREADGPESSGSAKV
jgi:hypothetical protein